MLGNRIKDSIKPISKEHQAYLAAKRKYRYKVPLTLISLLVSLIVLWEIAGNLRWIDP